MASNLIKTIEGVMECPLCHDRFNDAVILKCGHSFCRKCLQMNIARGTCPHVCPCCRKRLTTQERFMRNLIPDLVVKRINDALADAEEPRPPGEKVMCSRHPQSEKKYKCKGCRVMACSECMVGDHWQHVSSRPKNLEEVQREMQRMIKHSKTWMSEKATYDKKVKELKTMRTIARHALIVANSEIRDAYDEFKSCVIRKKKQMISLVSKTQRRLTKQENVLSTEQEEVNKRASLISKVRRNFEEALKSGHPKDILSAHKSCSQHFKDAYIPIPPLADIQKQLVDLTQLHFWVPTGAGQPSTSFGQIYSGVQPYKYNEDDDTDYDDVVDNSDDDSWETEDESEEDFEDEISGSGENEGDEYDDDEEEDIEGEKNSDGEERGDENDDDDVEYANNENDIVEQDDINDDVRNESVENNEDVDFRNGNNEDEDGQNDDHEDDDVENASDENDNVEQDDINGDVRDESINNNEDVGVQNEKREDEDGQNDNGDDDVENANDENDIVEQDGITDDVGNKSINNNEDVDVQNQKHKEEDGQNDNEDDGVENTNEQNDNVEQDDIDVRNESINNDEDDVMDDTDDDSWETEDENEEDVKDEISRNDESVGDENGMNGENIEGENNGDDDEGDHENDEDDDFENANDENDNVEHGASDHIRNESIFNNAMLLFEMGVMMK